MTEIEFTTETQFNPITEDVLPTDQPLIRVVRDVYDSCDQIPECIRLKSKTYPNVATEEREDGIFNIKILPRVPRWRTKHHLRHGRKMIGGGGSVCFQLKSEFPFVLNMGTPSSGGIEIYTTKDPSHKPYIMDIPDGLVTDLVQDSMVVVYPQNSTDAEKFTFEGIYGVARITSKDKIRFDNKYVTNLNGTEIYYWNGRVKLI